MLLLTILNSLALHPDLNSGGVNSVMCQIDLTGRALKPIVISMYQWESNRIMILECCTYVLLKSTHTEIQISRYKAEENN